MQGCIYTLERLPLSGSCRDQMVIGEAQAVESREPASLREWWVGRSFEPVQGEQETAGGVGVCVSFLHFVTHF